MDYKWLSKNKAKEVKALHNKKNRVETRQFVAEGWKCISDLINAFHLEAIITTQGWALQNQSLLRWPEKVFLVKDKSEMSRISAFSSPPDIIAVFKIPDLEHPDLSLDKNRNYLFLDDIQDPGNLGTIIRTSDWFGIYDIYASYGTADIYNPKVVQSSMGSLCRVKVRYTDLEKIFIKNPGVKVYGTLLKGIPLKEYNPQEKGIFLMGNEGRGISEPLKKYITFPLTIPPINKENHPDSLNVAVATAIILSFFNNNEI